MIFCTPQVAEVKPPYLMDVVGEVLLYDESTANSSLCYCDYGASIMHIEKRNQKMFNIIIIVVLTAILLTAIGGILLQRHVPPAMGGGMGVHAGNDLMQPESTQTSPTGNMVLTTGIILLFVGFGVIVLMLLVRRNSLHRNSS